MRLLHSVGVLSIYTISVLTTKVPDVFQVLKQRLSKELTLRQASKPPIPPLMTEAELGSIIREQPTKQIQSAEQLEEG